MIIVHDLQKVTDGHTAVAVPSLEVGAGEITGVIGPAGSGKGALLDVLIGRARPTTGEVRVAGVVPWQDRAAFSRSVGVLFAEDGLYPHRSCEANLAFHGRLFGVDRSRVDEVLTDIGLADHAAVRADRLPSGLARRLAFGRAILHSPRALIMAEPFARGDEASIALIGNLMRDLAEQGVAQLVLSVDAGRLASLCRDVHVLADGRVVEHYKPDQARRTDPPFKVPVRMEDKVVLINPAEILFADAEGGHAHLRTSEGRLRTQFTLSELEARLGPSGFFRAHRSFLVNLQHVREVVPYTRNSYSLILDDPAETEIPLSRTAAAELKDLLGF